MLVAVCTDYIIIPDDSGCGWIADEQGNAQIFSNYGQLQINNGDNIIIIGYNGDIQRWDSVYFEKHSEELLKDGQMKNNSRLRCDGDNKMLLTGAGIKFLGVVNR